MKAVAQAIPTFAMSCFYLTKTFCQELSSLMGMYWWSQHEKENTLHWISWENLTKPKAQVGLGFREMHSFNISMLSRQIWRRAKLLKTRYFPHTHILDVVAKDGIS